MPRNISVLASKFPFDTLVWLAWGSFAGIFLVALLLTVTLPRVKAASKKPFLCLVHAYAALTLAIFTTACPVEGAIFAACVFWIAGYLMYGILCASSKPAPARKRYAEQAAVYSVPDRPQPRPDREKPAPAGAVRNSVRLEHAVTVTRSLLNKNLVKADRQELEKLLNTLEVLKVKGTLTAAEGEFLNESFNLLLKLMAKYNV